MNIERPLWAVVNAGRPVGHALRSIFEPHHRLTGELMRLLDDLEERGRKCRKGA